MKHRMKNHGASISIMGICLSLALGLFLYLGHSAQAAKPSDFNGDGKVDLSDAKQLTQAYGKSKGEPGYDSKLDLDDDGVIGFEDVLIFSSAYGKRRSQRELQTMPKIVLVFRLQQNICRGLSGVSLLTTTGTTLGIYEHLVSMKIMTMGFASELDCCRK